jgi:hypothetical protein
MTEHHQLARFAAYHRPRLWEGWSLELAKLVVSCYGMFLGSAEERYYGICGSRTGLWGVEERLSIRGELFLRRRSPSCVISRARPH